MCLSFLVLAVSDVSSLAVPVLTTGFNSSDLALMLLMIECRTEVEGGPSGSFVVGVALALLDPVFQLDCGHGDGEGSVDCRGSGGDESPPNGIATSSSPLWRRRTSSVASFNNLDRNLYDSDSVLGPSKKRWSRGGSSYTTIDASFIS